MHNNKKYAPWVRMIMSDDTPGGTSAEDVSAAIAAAQSPEVGAQSADHDQESGSDDSDDDYDTDGRGSKRAVLADLARERDKRQSLQAERDELQKQLDEINRSKMTEQEKLQADLEAERKRSAELESELTTSRQQAWAREALASVGLPAEMADRLRGSSLEEIKADAEALKATLGYDRAPVDPSQGKGAPIKPKFNDLSAALSAHYEKGN